MKCLYRSADSVLGDFLLVELANAAFTLNTIFLPDNE